MIEEKSPSYLAIFGWVWSLIGLVFAGTVATGAELTKLALTIPLLAIGALLCVLFSPSRTHQLLLFSIAVVSGYLLVRGVYSPVWDLARRDLFLIVGGFLAYVSAMSVLSGRTAQTFFLFVIILLVCGNAVVSFYQWQVDEGFAFLRPQRVDVAGVSGFYYHRNYLAGFLEIACPVLAAACLSRRKVFERGALLLPLTVGFFICFLSNSRSGFAVMVVASTVAASMEFSRNRKLVKGSKVSRLFVGLVAVAMALVLLAGGKLLLASIIEARGGTESAIGSFDGRMKLTGIAFDIWRDSPFFGMGAESFSYLFPKYFDGFRGRLGNPQMVHSDFLQLMTDYGLIGFFSVVVLIAFFGFLLLKPLDLEKISSQESLGRGLWLRSASVGILTGEVLRATIDFNLHIAPNLILFAMVLAGGVVSINHASQDFSTQTEKSSRAKWLSLLATLALTLAAAGHGIKAGWNEVVSVSNWVALEIAEEKKEVREPMLRAYSEKAPSFKLHRRIARHSMSRALQSGLQSDFEISKNDWAEVVQRHPFDGESLTNYARCLDDTGRSEEAEEFHLRALEAVGRREMLYGVIHGVGWHLAKRARKQELQRRPGEALFLYQSAQEAFHESRKRGFARSEESRVALDWVDRRIDFLEGARIDPEQVEILSWRESLL